MGKGKKGKKAQDDDWEADLDEIAKEQGIDNNVEETTEIALPTKKEREKEKERKTTTR